MSNSKTLVIRAAQFEAFRAPRLNQFLQRLADYVARAFPEHAGKVSGPDGRAALEALVQRARAYGLEDEHNISLFIGLCFGLGNGFDARPEYDWIKDLLLTQGLGASARMYLIYKQLPERCPETPAASGGEDGQRTKEEVG